MGADRVSANPAAAAAVQSERVAARWRMLGLLCLAEICGMSLWFSATAVAPALSAVWHLSAATQTWLTLSVQIGFVAGTLLSAVLNLSDVVPVRKLFAVCSWAAALANLAILVAPTSSGWGVLALRFATGALLAGVYPTGMKMAAGWFVRERGLAIGAVVGALTLGSAAPHLFSGLFVASWRPVLLSASIAAAAGGLLLLATFREGPFAAPAPRFEPAFAARAIRHRGVRLALTGYLGHMWELYAMWAWVPAFILASFQQARVPNADSAANFVAFAVIGIGAAGCGVAGWLADRWGRSLVTIISMAVSGACALTVGLLFGASPGWTAAVLLIWGFAVVADSAQFSAAITELSEARFTGTALTLQTSLGFLLTMASIRLLPVFEHMVGWRFAMVLLVLGPVVGILGMAALKRSPFAGQIAGGRG